MPGREGGQSPPPEEQSGKQQNDAPSSGKGVNDKSQDNKEESKKQLEALESNPTGPMDKKAGDAVAKTTTPDVKQ